MGGHNASHDDGEVHPYPGDVGETKTGTTWVLLLLFLGLLAGSVGYIFAKNYVPSVYGEASTMTQDAQKARSN